MILALILSTFCFFVASIHLTFCLISLQRRYDKQTKYLNSVLCNYLNHLDIFLKALNLEKPEERFELVQSALTVEYDRIDKELKMLFAEDLQEHLF